MTKIAQIIDNYINSNIEKCAFTCYTDGSCNNLSANREGGAAYIVFRNGEEIHRRSKSLINTTNNRAEMLAIISAVNVCPVGAEITVFTDSKYAMCSFISRRPLRQVKANKDLVKLYRNVSMDKNVRFEWVKGHNGNKYNEMVDAMANGEYHKMKENLLS